MADTELQQLAKTDRNPVQETRYRELLSQNGGQVNPNPTGSASGLDTTSILNNAKAVNQFYKEQNQPVIAATQATKAPLEQRYKDLLASIKGNQQVAENRQTLTTNNELGKRGIVGSSGIAQQEITNAVNPITQQYTSLQKDTTNQQNMDISAIDKAIAELNAGNPASAVSSATGIQNAIQSANQFQQQLEATQKQNDIENALKQLQLTSGVSDKDRYVPLPNGTQLYDTKTGQIVANNPKTFAGGGEPTGDGPV